jgi:hypothetical protein
MASVFVSTEHYPSDPQLRKEPRMLSRRSSAMAILGVSLGLWWIILATVWRVL